MLKIVLIPIYNLYNYYLLDKCPIDAIIFIIDYLL